MAVAMAECCLAGNIGATVNLPSSGDPLGLLFAEDPSRIVVSVPVNSLAEVSRIASEYGVTAEAIGDDRRVNAESVQAGEKFFWEASLSLLRHPFETGRRSNKPLEKITV